MAGNKPAKVAVKIEPNYSGPTVWVPDASRAVGVATQLSSTEQRAKYLDPARRVYEAQRKEAWSSPSRDEFHRWLLRAAREFQ